MVRVKNDPEEIKIDYQKLAERYRDVIIEKNQQIDDLQIQIDLLKRENKNLQIKLLNN